MLKQIINNPIEEEIKVIQNGLGEYNSKFLEKDKKDNYPITSAKYYMEKRS